MNKIAEVIIDNSARQLGRVFHYIIPQHLLDSINVGSFVAVPFGKANKSTEAYVIGIIASSEFKELKFIKEALTKDSLFKKELIQLAMWMSKYYMCNMSECLKLMLPPAGSIVSRQTNLNVSLKISREEAAELIKSGKIRGKNQVGVLDCLIQQKLSTASDILNKANAGYDVLRSLEKKGIIEIHEEITDKSPLKNKFIKKTNPFQANEHQGAIIQNISSYIEKSKSGEFLIHGVTGSGKTEVYLQLISKVLEKGQQAIALVPEISLTPQMIERFVGRFGQEVAILHSRLSDGERSDQWHKIKESRVKVVVGARSAVFAPFDNLGIIIIDEEHEHTYKSEKSPKYHAHEVARKRVELENCILVLGSATPSTETYYNALNGKIKLLDMPERANNSLLPKVEIVDMRRELEEGNKTIFSRSLYNLIKENLEKGNQTILFLNRRGFSSFVLCRKCGYVAKCRNCNISLTYHLNRDRLLCHYCGYNRANFNTCPSCGSEHIRHFGVGTQKIEEEVKKYFTNATVLRMDLDTTTKKNSHEEILKKFKEENINILIGTQMIAKGHDFPNVTLVGVISADLMLNMEDFRSTEKTFQLLTQVAGRAGRAEKEGKVIIQTYETDNFSIQAAKNQDFIGYYNQEIILRKELSYPPFCDIASIMITGENADKVKETAEKIEKILNEELKGPNNDIIVSKAVPAPISKIKSRNRWRVIVKCTINEELKKKIDTLLQREALSCEKWCNISLDINPFNML
jgi:primosomal protein N' (replication factor Y)